MIFRSSGSMRNSSTGSAEKVAGTLEKKELIGTPRTWAIAKSLLAPMRFVPRSYFWTCWNVTPTALPRAVWERPRVILENRSCSPTKISTEWVGIAMIAEPRMKFDRFEDHGG